METSNALLQKDDTCRNEVYERRSRATSHREYNEKVLSLPERNKISGDGRQSPLLYDDEVKRKVRTMAMG